MSFLDARTFRTTDDPGARRLYDLLWDIFNRSNAVEPLIEDAGLKVGKVNLDQPMSEAWLEILQYAAREGALRRLVQVIAEHNQGRRVKELLAEVESLPTATTGDPFCASLLSGLRPMFDREPLRDRLRELADDDGWRVFVVNGPRTSGKSHSWFLMSHVSAHVGGFECARVDLASWQGPAMTAVEVMDLVAVELGWTRPAVDTTAQEETQLRILLAWFKRQARTLSGPLWLVFDAVDGPTLSASGSRLVTELANAAGNAEAGPLRVVLLGFDGTLANTVDAFAPRVPLSYLAVDDLKAFFADVADQRGYKLDKPTLERLVTTALGELPEFDPMRLGEIAARAARAAAAVFPPLNPGNG